MKPARYKSIFNFFLIFFISFCFSACKKNNEGNNGTPLFKLIPADKSGITFNNNVEETFQTMFSYFAYVYNGAGVAVGDINNDKLIDIYFTANETSNKLYLNKGNFKFEDISASAGVEGMQGWHNGVSMVDINHDGFLDIYICRGGWQDSDEDRKNLLYINNGDLTFTEESGKFGLDDMGYSTQASFFDMDNDNDLDVYIINRPDSFYLTIDAMYEGRYKPNEYNRDKLYKNENGFFKEVGLESGITETYGYTLGVMTADFNSDGYKDIFISNDYAEKDNLFINNGDGTFTRKLESYFNHISLASMGNDMADINNDGLEDLIVLEMQPADYTRAKVSMIPMDVDGYDAIIQRDMYKQYLHNVLHLNTGNSFYCDIAYLAGITDTDWSWSCLANDYDNDGYRDLFITNGFRRDLMDGDVERRITTFVQNNRHRIKNAQDLFSNHFDEFMSLYKEVKLRNYLFRNNGDLTFKDVSAEWGFNTTSLSNGAAVADLDNDGDLDLVINNLNESAYLFENKQMGNSYIDLDLKGPGLNPFGIGAVVTIYYGNNIQYFENKNVRGYLSSSTTIPHFGLGSVKMIDSIHVRWTDGKVNILKNVPANRTVIVDYLKAIAKPDVTKGNMNTLFKKSGKDIISPWFVHKENEFNEYEDQKLLPHMFSKSGPFISVGDVNNDGMDDFFIGGTKGQPGKIYLQKDDKFVEQKSKVFTLDRQYEDMGSAFFDADNDGDQDLYVVSGGSEFPEGHELYQDRLYINNGNAQFSASVIPTIVSSGSCVVPHDIDKDGDIDIFVGGQVLPGNYPKPPKSYVLINEKGTFHDKTSEVAPGISHIGMVNSAAFTDLNNDGISELIIVGEWMPVKIFTYDDGKFIDISSTYSLDYTEGWWNKVVANDLDNDGDQDLILGNLGKNYKFKAGKEKPFQVFADDFDNNGANDIFLAYYHGDRLKPVRGKEIITEQMPIMSRYFLTFYEFAQADMIDILGDQMYNSTHYKAHLFSSIILINENGQFTKKELPAEAQFSALNGILVNDFDDDGIKDLIIAGNKFNVEVETTPADASPGFFLKGEGDFTFKSEKPLESGIFVPYDVKDIQSVKLGDKWILLVSSNNDSLRVFQQN